MKLWEIFRYDVASQLRRARAAIYCIGLIGMTLLIATTFVDDARRDGVLLNAPIVVAATLLLVSMTGLLVVAAVAGEAATRDTQVRIDPLVYTTPVSKATYLAGRFLSAFAIFAVLLLIVPVTISLSRYFPGADPTHFGPFRIGPYLHAYLLIALPNAFIATALLFSLVTLTRRAMTGYLGATVLFFNSIIQDELVAGVLKRWDLAKQFDVFGFILVRAQWRSSTVLQRNTMPLALDQALLTNRLVWLGVAVVALLVVYARFRMAHYAPARRWPWRRRPIDAPVEAAKPWTVPVGAARVRGSFDRATRARQLLAIAMHSYREMITSWAALLIPAIGLLLFKITPELIEVALGTPGRPATGRLALLYIKFSTIGPVVGALIAYFAGQLVWRERDAREHDIADVTPVSEGLSLVGKFSGLGLVLVTLQAVMMAAGIATQISQGYSNFEPWLYVRVLFGLKLVDYLIFAALAMVVHVIVNQKYLAMSIAMLAWLYGDFAGEIGVEHKLLIFGANPAVTYSDLSGFGASLIPWRWFNLYWAGWALLFALLARLFWVRGHEGQMARRIALARQRFTRVPAAVAVVALGLIVIAGGFVFYNTNVLNDYEPEAERLRQGAEYERRYGRYEGIAQPIVAATKLRVELHPADRRADVRGTYRLENRSGRAIDTIHLVTHKTHPTTAVVFDRAARPAVIDDKLGYQIYTLDTPLALGDSLNVSFEVRMAPRGFTNVGISSAITENGTLIEHRPDGGRSWLPSVGYRRGGEIANDGERRAHGLPPRPDRAPDDPVVRNDEMGIEQIDLETIIGTDADQIAVAPGALRRSWTERGRRYFHYVTDAPIRNGFPILSARYAVHRERANGVEIEVLHHPKHVWNVERIARGAQASLAYYSREFGPYPHRQLRFVEFPSTGGNRMTGHPGTIIWSESFAFAQPETDWREIDFPFAVVAHEVAHQWWGNQVVPARADGGPLLSESLSWYSAMMVVEKTFGREHFDRTMSVMRESYLTPHETPDVPLLRAGDWLAAYRTGALAMYSLREAIGEQRVNAALRRMVDEFRPGTPPYPTSLDLYAQLRAVTPESTQPLLKDLFEEVTFWDLRVKSMETKLAAGGAHRVTLDIEAYKVKVSTGGREHRVAMNDAVDVAVFDDGGKSLYRQTHRIHAGQQTISVTVAAAPASARIDPDNKLLDRQRDDNARQVEGG